MRLSLKERDWGQPSLQGNGVFYYLWFDVEDATGEDLLVRVDDGVFLRVNPAEPRPKVESFTERMTLLAVNRLVALGREHVDDLLDEGYRYPTYTINLDEQDADEIRLLPGAKECRYQGVRTGDLYCSVAHKNPPAATTRHLCSTCTLPDSRLACAHLHHALVAFNPLAAPAVVRAQCDIGRTEVGDASMCRPGEHACWVKEVEFAAPEQRTASPLALHESFDYLDALWTNVMKTHLLRLRGTAVVGKLATPCSSATDLESKLSALADIINSFDIADGDLAPAHRTDVNYGKGRTLARLESALVHKLGADTVEDGAVTQVKEGVRVLRSAMALRTGYQHTGGGAAGKLPAAFGAFRVPYPPPSPGLAWARIQSEVLRALEVLREVLRGLD